MGISLGGAAETAEAMAKAAIISGLTVRDFADRFAWAIKIGFVGYFATIFWALIGELFSGLAALIGLRSKKNSGPDAT